MLGELAGEDEADGGLDLAGGDGGLLVVAGELGGLGGELLEDVVDEGVHDGHGLGGDADVGVDLLEHLEDVDLVGLYALLRGECKSNKNRGGPEIPGKARIQIPLCF